MVKGSLRWSARINFLKKRFATEISRFALSMNSIVHPAESTRCGRLMSYSAEPLLTLKQFLQHNRFAPLFMVGHTFTVAARAREGWLCTAAMVKY